MGMDHTEAINSQAVEKYFLGELKGAQRDAFEEHFFDCAECAADVKTTAILVDNVREVLRSVPVDAKKVPGREPRTGGFLNWWKPAYSFATIAVLVAAIGYQNFFTIPHLREATEAQNFQTLSFSSESRGESAKGANFLGEANIPEIVVPAHRAFGFYFDIPAKSPGTPEVNYASYGAQIVNQSGAIKVTIPIAAERAKDPVELMIPGEVLEPGRYDLVILGYQATGGKAEEIIRHPFILRTK